MGRRILLACAFFLISIQSFSSTGGNLNVSSSDEFAMWGNVRINKHIFSGLSLSLSGEMRSKDNMDDISLWWINPEITFRFNDYFNVEGGYRYAGVNRDDGYESAHRWYVGGTAGISFGPAYLFLREMFEQIVYESSTVSYLRSRLRLELRFDDFLLTPFASVENFLYLSGERGGRTGIMRYTGGVRIRVSSSNSFNVYYRYQRSYSASLGEHILGMGYTFSF